MRLSAAVKTDGAAPLHDETVASRAGHLSLEIADLAGPLSDVITLAEGQTSDVRSAGSAARQMMRTNAELGEQMASGKQSAAAARHSLA
jgi:hypothetical protein